LKGFYWWDFFLQNKNGESGLETGVELARITSEHKQKVRVWVLLRTAGREDQGEWVYLVVLAAGEPEEDLATWQQRSPSRR